MPSSVPSLTLNNGVAIPQLGFGVFLIPPDETAAAVTTALEAGYRLIDTAQGYRNEKGVGEAIARSDVSRDEIFVTTNLVNEQHGYDRALAAFDESMKRLGIDVLDLFLIHWPLPMFDRYVETWRALEQLLADGRVRVVAMAEKSGRTPAQVVLRWHIQVGNVVIPKSISPHRIRENIDIFDFELDDADMETFTELDMARRLGPYPNEFYLV